MPSTSSLPFRLKTLSDQALIESTKAAVRKERSATTDVLHHFIEVENRRLYADRYTSLFAWAMEELHYSEGAAPGTNLSMSTSSRSRWVEITPSTTFAYFVAVITLI